VPFLTRPGERAMPEPRNLGTMLRQEWVRQRRQSKEAHAVDREGEPHPSLGLKSPADVKKWKAQPWEDPGELETQSDWNPDVDSISCVVKAVSGFVWDEYKMKLQVAGAEIRALTRRQRDILDDAKTKGDPNPDGYAQLLAEQTRAEHKYYRGWKFLVSHAIDEIHGMFDAKGAYVIKAGDDGELATDVVDALERGGLLLHFATVARAFQELTEQEQGNFGGQPQPTIQPVDLNAAAAPSKSESAKDAMHKAAPNTGVAYRAGDIEHDDAQPASP